MEYTEFLVSLARGAGDIMLDYREKGVDSVLHGDAFWQTVTAADHAVSAYVQERISEVDSVLLSEESEDDGSRLDATDVLIVDEIDGTHAFASGKDGFCFLAARLVEGRLREGVLFAPSQDVLVVTNGEAVFIERDGQRSSLALAPVNATWTGFDYGGRGETDRAALIEQVMRAGGLSESVLVDDCVGARLLEVMLGRASAFMNVQSRTKEWDLAGPHAILAALGYVLVPVQGDEMRYNKKDVSDQGGQLVVHPDLAESMMPEFVRLRAEMHSLLAEDQ